MQPDPRELLLDLLKQHQPISVWRLADISKLGIGTVTTIIHPMIKSGELIETADRSSPPKYLFKSDSPSPLMGKGQGDGVCQQAQLDL